MARGIRKVGYADESMVNEVKELKKQGVEGFWCEVTVWNCYTGERRIYKPVKRNTANGISAYCNDMCSKYLDDDKGIYVGAVVYYFDAKGNYNELTTYNC